MQLRLGLTIDILDLMHHNVDEEKFIEDSKDDHIVTIKYFATTKL